MKKWIFSLLLILPLISFASEGSLTVKAVSLKGFSGAKLEKMQTAFKVLELVVNSEEFKQRVLNFPGYASNENRTNEEIFAHIMEGREDLQQDTPGEMNFHLRLYSNIFSKVIGYTSPSTNVISINSKFFNRYRPHEVAGNLMHEWLHKMGYGHASAKEHDSVPYAIGYIVEEMAEKYLKTMK